MEALKPRCQSPALDAKSDFRRALRTWFQENGKDYPWRRTSEPYPILVSEMMLQQTRIATVIGKGFYTRFLEKFPTLPSLAAADDESLLKAWEGLGYYRRARLLRSAAAAVIERHAGIFPSSEAELLALPGIGSYTASALLAFAFGKCSALVDGNVSRVLSRLMDDHSPIDSGPTIRRHRQWAGDMCAPAYPAIHHQAMMELGQIHCRPGVPDCVSCPVSSFCKSPSPHLLPVKKSRVEKTEITEHAIWCTDRPGFLLLHKVAGPRRTGLWSLPLRPLAECTFLEKISSSQYHITRYVVSLQVYRGNSPELLPGDEWIAWPRIAALPIAAPFRKVIEKLRDHFGNGM